LKFIFASQDTPVHAEFENEPVGEEEGNVDETEKMPKEQQPPHRQKPLQKSHTHQLVSLVKAIPEPRPVLGNKRGPNVVFVTYQKR
jgi:hypothetical protein